MVDSATVTIIATLVQTIVLTLTLLVFVFQFRSQEKAIREASYQNLLGRYNDFIMSGSNSRLFSRLLPPGSEMSDDDLATARQLMISYGIIEEAYELYKKGWIDSESWEQWNSWLKVLSKHPNFARLHEASSGMFDNEFQQHVSRILASSS